MDLSIKNARDSLEIFANYLSSASSNLEVVN